MDTFLLKEKMDYRDLKDSYLIIITPKDLIGEGAMMNVFRMKDTRSGKELNDRQSTVYVNCSGKGSEQYPVLIQFCQYALTNEVPVDADPFIQKIHKAVPALNQNNVWRKEHMTIEEYGNDMYENGRDDGRAEGRAEAVRILADTLMEEGYTEEQAIRKVSRKFPGYTLEEIRVILLNKFHQERPACSVPFLLAGKMRTITEGIMVQTN